MTISELIKANQTWLPSTPLCVWVDGDLIHRDCKVCWLPYEYPDTQYTVDTFGFSYVCLTSNEQLGGQND